MANKKSDDKEEYLICTDDTVIEKGIRNFNLAMKEARTFNRTFLGLNVYICKVICNVKEV